MNLVADGEADFYGNISPFPNNFYPGQTAVPIAALNMPIP